MDLLRRHDREPVGETEAHLMAENRERAGTRSIRLLDSLLEDPVQQGVILEHAVIVTRRHPESASHSGQIPEEGDVDEETRQ